MNRIYFNSDYIIFHKEIKYLHNHFAENCFLSQLFYKISNFKINTPAIINCKTYVILQSVPWAFLFWYKELQNIFKDTFLLTDFRHLSKTTTTQHSHLNKTKRLPFPLGSCVDYQHKCSICSSQYVGTTYSTVS